MKKYFVYIKRKIIVFEHPGGGIGVRIGLKVLFHGLLNRTNLCGTEDQGCFLSCPFVHNE